MKMLIVSSYHRQCGIAQYVEHLEIPLRDQSDVEIEIAALPVDLLKQNGGFAKAMAVEAIEKIAEKARASDVVNLQFEPGLYGGNSLDRWRVIKRIIRASRKVIITYHTPPSLGGRYALRPKAFVAFLRDYHAQLLFRRLFSEILRNQGKFFHIVQTKREANRFAMLGIKPERIFDLPLSFIGQDDKKKLTRKEKRPSIDEQYDLHDKVLIGFFGFLSPYKGVEVVLRAMNLLPDQYHLMVVGGTHPEAIELYNVEQPYISKLMGILKDYSKKKKKGGVNRAPLMDRVTFCGSVKNDDFNELMAACDAIVLPYAEVGQTSSGPAAIALDLRKPLYSTRNHCFSELAKYATDALSFFEIGNHIELAQMIERNIAASPKAEEARRKYSETFSVEGRAGLYLNLCRKLRS